MSNILDSTRPVRSGEQLDLEKLEPYLRGKFPEVEGPLVVEQFPAGHSNLTYFVGLGPLELVLRRPPFGSKVKSAHDMGREYRVLSKLHQAYPPAPEPLLHCEDESILGAPFYAMRRIRGVILRRDPPAGLEISPDVARRMGLSFIGNLAQLHDLDYEQVGLGDLGKPKGYMERQVNGWIQRYSGSQTDDIPRVEEISKWLVEHLPPEVKPSLIHNDYKYDNVIIDSGDLTKIIGVLDWEMATIGDPLSDLGTAISYWIDPHDPDEMQIIRWGPTTLSGSPTRSQLVERYAERTGRDVTNIHYYFAFALFKTAVIAQQIYYRFHHGMTKDERFGSFIEATKILFRAADRAIETGKI